MIKLINILNEIKVNNPAGEFCFVDNGGETYYLDNRFRQDKESPTSQEEGDKHLSFDFPVNDSIEFISDDPLEFAETIESMMKDNNFDPDFDIADTNN